MSMAKAAEVASFIVMPVRSSAIQSRLGTRTPEVVPLNVKQMSWSLFVLLKSGRWP